MKTAVSNKLILEAHKEVSTEVKLKIEKECPELFKSNLEVGKWYKEPSDLGNKYRFIFIEKIGYKKIFGYGFKGDGSWFSNYSYFSGEFVLATEEEVKEAIIKEAEKRGFKKGVILKKEGINEKAYSVGLPINGFVFRPEDNGLDSVNCCGWIFKNGKWAEIISNPIEEKIKKYERKIEELKKQL